MRKPQYKNLSQQLRAGRRQKAIKNAWQEWGKPFCIALVILPILWALLSLSILVLQPQAEYKRLNYPPATHLTE
jgi:hypothetical protein